ncbi:hypothetical protein LSH36_622g02023 [Paralvinella palmiformis]|uniref:Uncharacterized protein n=1 Tax=Paralvinella palmiformis TaxID=53620 RepID=A0AAD9MWB6_9ANNE|nr:hypothetical protein LSH36_622g02023 [Paralvinella palmiformis]
MCTTSKQRRSSVTIFLTWYKMYRTHLWIINIICGT